MRRDAPMDPNWLVDAVREFDEELAKKPAYTGYSPFRASSPSTAKESERGPTLDVNHE